MPQNGSVSPGAETAVSSPEKANLIGVTAEGPGAVSNLPDGAAAVALKAEAVVVGGGGAELVELGLDRVVVAVVGLKGPLPDHVVEGAVRGDLGLHGALVGGATPDDRGVER